MVKYYKGSAPLLYRKLQIVLTSFIFVFICCSMGFGELNTINKNLVSITTSDSSTLQDALDIILQQTGYKIVVSEELSALQISGVYKNISIENFLRRVLKKYNVSIVYDETKRVAIVREFGKSMQGGKAGSYVAVPRDQLLDSTLGDAEDIDPLSGISRAELQQLQEQQLEELERLRNDPDAIDALSGIPMAELKNKQTDQMERLKSENDPEQIDSISGISQSELRKKQEEQLQEIEKQKSDPKAVDPLSGIPYIELREKQEKQLERLKSKTGNSSSDPLMNYPFGDE